MSFASLLLATNVAATLFMAGIIWFVQVVHYPLMKNVGEEKFKDYHDRHSKLTTRIVAIPMVIELLTAVLLVWYPPIPNGALLLLAVGLLGIIWVSTFLLQIPCHEELTRGFDAKIHRQLVSTNWIRTICWTLRGMLVCTFLIGAISRASIT